MPKTKSKPSHWKNMTVYMEEDIKDLFDLAVREIPGINSSSQFLRECALLYLRTQRGDLLEGKEQYASPGSLSLNMEPNFSSSDLDPDSLESVVYKGVIRAMEEGTRKRRRNNPNLSRKVSVAK